VCRPSSRVLDLDWRTPSVASSDEAVVRPPRIWTLLGFVPSISRPEVRADFRFDPCCFPPDHARR